MNTAISRGAPARPVGQSAKRFPKKRPRLLEQVTASFRVRNETPWWLRDARRCGGSQNYSWIDLFMRDGFRCVYCGSDLSASALTIATATHDHVVPRCLFFPENEANRGVNLVACCSLCNALKGNWHPASPEDPAWQSRASFVDAARRHIEEAAGHRHGQYQRFVGSAAHITPVEEWSPRLRAWISIDRDDYTKSAYANLGYRPCQKTEASTGNSPPTCYSAPAPRPSRNSAGITRSKCATGQTSTNAQLG